MRYLRWMMVCGFILTTSILSAQALMSDKDLDQLCKDKTACLEYFQKMEAESYGLLSQKDYAGFIAYTKKLSGVSNKYGLTEFSRNVFSGVYEMKFMQGDYDGALVLIDSVLELSDNSLYTKMMYLSRAGSIYNYKEQYVRGIKLLQEAMIYAKQIEDPFLSGIYSELGGAFQKTGKYPEALEMLLKSIEIEDREDVKAGKYLNIVHLYSSLGNLKKAKEFLVLAKAKYDKSINNYYTTVLVQESMLFAREAKLDSAKVILDEVKAFQDREGIKPYKNYYLLVLGDYYRQIKDYKNLDVTLDQVQLDDIDQNFKLLFYYYLKSDLLIAKADLVAARKHMIDYRKLIKEAFNVNAVQDQIEQEIKLNKLEGDYKEALYLTDYYNSRKDSIYRTGQESVVLELEEKYQSAEKEKQILQLNSKNEIAALQLSRSNKFLILTGLGLLCFLVLSLFLYRLFRMTKRQKEQLIHLNESLNKSLSQNKALLKEIHHRVKNNLQVVSSLLYLQSRYVDDSAAKEAINTGRSRVQSMSLLHQKLYQKDNLKAVNIRDYFKDLGENLFSTYKISDDNIQFEMDIDEMELDIDTVIPMGLVVNELISNSLKHAFKDGDQGLVKLVIKQQGSALKVEVSDNGVGLPNNALPEKSTSLGVQLIKSFAQKLNAKVEIRNQLGTSISMTFDPGDMKVSAA